MSCLVKMRAMRDELSVNERRLAEFILDNTQLLRDYSSQQLADAVGVSQSSVVKFSQKMGYKGYPSLKLAIYETYAVEARGQNGEASGHPASQSPLDALSELGHKKLEALENTVRLNDAKQLQNAVKAVRKARAVLVVASPGSISVARYFCHQLQELGYLALFNAEIQVNLKLLERLDRKDVLCMICDMGREESMLEVARRARDAGTRVISLTRYAHNAVSMQADIQLSVAPLEDEKGMQRLLYRSAQMHLVESLIAGLLD